jgi:hypothetical protein
LELVQLVAPSIPTGPTFAREQIQTRPGRKLLDTLKELVGLARMLANWREDNVADVIS